MRSLTHRAYDDMISKGLNASNRLSLDRPLILNCTGTYNTKACVNTYNRIGRDDYYLLYIVSGKLKVATDEGEIVSEKGDLWIFPPHTLYKYSHADGDELEYMFVHFTGSEVESTLAECSLKLHPQVNRVSDDGGIYLRFREIFDAFTHRDHLRDRELSALLERLILTLGRSIKGADSASTTLKRSIAYINASYDSQISVPELARIENLSVSRYSTLFKKLMGIPPLEYITGLRMASACTLLATTDLPICDVGISVGYSDPHFFSRMFKKSIGMSPAAFRKQERW